MIPLRCPHLVHGWFQLYCEERLAWLAEEKSEDALGTRLEEAAKAARVGRRKRGSFDTDKTEAIDLS